MMTDLHKVIFLFFVSFSFVWAKHEEYEGYTVYEVIAKNHEQGLLISQLENQIPIDIWMTPAPGRPGQVFVSKELKEDFENILTTLEIEYKAAITNIKEHLDKEDEALAAAKTSDESQRSISFNEIPRYDAVNRYIDDLARQYPNTVKVELAGKSAQGRDIKILKISTTNFQNESKPIVCLQSLLHAREWVTLPATLYAIEKLVVDVTESDLIRDIDWIIMPIANPDGYEWSHTNARFWRKNRATGLIGGDVCIGVDLNRNFDIHWSTASSNNVCSDTYHGRTAFSEPESQAVRNVFRQYSDRIEVYIDVHSHGSMILYAYGNGELPPNALTVNLVAVNMARAIDRVKVPGKPNYIVGSVFNVLYAASGGSSDYSQSIGIPLSYTYELPGPIGSSGLNGFLVDPSFIRQAGIETWEGIKVGARYARDNYLKKL